jgi:hypothetical protein
MFEQQGARRRSTDFRLGERLGQRDHVIELRKPKIKPDWMSQADYDRAPDSLKAREVSSGLPGGKAELEATMRINLPVYSSLSHSSRLEIDRDALNKEP